MSNHTCASTNTATEEQSSFLDGRWDAHEIGWLVAGATAAVTVVISLVNAWLHATNYYRPQEQRQILRIIYMPAVYAVVSFFSYRFFRSYTYYEISVVVYEALAVMAFLMLLLTYIGSSSEDQREALREKEKKKIPIPFCCIRYRPTKPYFLHALKWSVLQYAFIRPLLSIAGIICEAYDVLCPEEYAYYFAEVYIEAIDFVSISIALYGLIVLYGLVKDQLQGRKPLSKFMCIKGIIFLVFYQGFVFSALASHGVIHATDFWTTTNIADGLNALCVCCEMVLFAAFMLWAYSYKEYRNLRPEGAKRTSIWRPLWDSINYWDFVVEGGKGIRFLVDFIRKKPGTHASDEKKLPTGFDFDNAFGTNRPSLSEMPMVPKGANGDALADSASISYNRADLASHEPWSPQQNGRAANMYTQPASPASNSSPSWQQFGAPGTLPGATAAAAGLPAGAARPWQQQQHPYAQVQQRPNVQSRADVQDEDEGVYYNQSAAAWPQQQQHQPQPWSSRDQQRQPFVGPQATDYR